MSLQGSNDNQTVCYQKVHAFMNKLPMRKKRVIKVNMANFKLLDTKCKDAEASESLIQNITEHLTELEMKILHCLGEKPNFASWIKKTFFAKCKKMINLLISF